MRKEFQTQFDAVEQTLLIIILPQVCINAPILCHHLIWRDLSHVDILRNTRQIHYVHDTMQIREDEQKVGHMWETLVRLLGYREWKVSLVKIQGLTHQWSFLGPRARGHLHFQDIWHSKGKDKCFRLHLHTKEAQGLVIELIHFTPSHSRSGHTNRSHRTVNTEWDLN